MSVGGVICLFVLFFVILSFLIPLPEWAVMVMIGALAIAYLFGGKALSWKPAGG
jgi:uncharacterized membrane protein YkgB